jgi:hypothetical protein
MMAKIATPPMPRNSLSGFFASWWFALMIVQVHPETFFAAYEFLVRPVVQYCNTITDPPSLFISHQKARPTTIRSDA